MFLSDHKELKEQQVLQDSVRKEHKEQLERTVLRERQELKGSKELKVQRVLRTVFLML